MDDPSGILLPLNSPINKTEWYNRSLDLGVGIVPPIEEEEEYATLYEASIEVVVLLSIFYGGISIIAVIGNTLVIWIVATARQMQTVTNMYIANLAFADVIIGMFCIPFQFQAALLQRWNLPKFMCAFCPFVQVLSVNVSVFTLTAIALDRHRAIIKPFSSRPTKCFSKIIITLIWTISTFFAVPIAIAFRVVQVDERIRENGIVHNITRPFCENVNLSSDQIRSYRYYLVFVQYIIPFCMISFIYVQMAVKLWGSRTPGNAQDARDITLLRNKKKVIKMLIIVVVVFGLCWLPLQSYNILHVTWDDVNEYRFINIIWFCCDWLAMSNSCCNPFIYGIYNEKFKREFNKRFSVCFCKFDVHDSTERTMSVFTRASSVRSNYTNSSTRRSNILVQHQRNTNAKPADGYHAITDMEQRTPMNNNKVLENSNKGLWMRDTINSNGLHGNVHSDCACSVLGGDQWPQSGKCKGICLVRMESMPSKASKTISEVTKEKLSSILNGKGPRKMNSSSRRGNDDILEMTEYSILSADTTKNSKNNVKFNNF